MKSLSKNMKMIIGSVGGILVLGIVTVVLILTQPKEPVIDDPDDPTEDKSFVLSDHTVDDITKVHIINKEEPEGYEIIPSKTKGEWLIQSIEKAPLNQTQFTSVLNTAASVKAVQSVEMNATDLEKYGLTKPTAQIAVTYHEDEVFEFILGNVSPTGGYYLAKKGSSDVYLYLETKASAFLQDRFAFVSLNVMGSYNAEEAPTINRLSIERFDLEEPIVFEALPVDDSEEMPMTYQSHKITSPVEVLADSSVINDILFGLYDLNAIKAVWVGIEEQDLVAAGLDKPSCVVSMRTGGKIYTLTLGKAYYADSNEPDGTALPDGFYGTFSEVPDVIYIFSTSTLPWLTTEVENVMSRLFLTPYIYSLDSVTIKTNDKTYVMGITGDASSHEFTFNGEATTSEDKFKELYQFLISASGNELYMEEQKDDFICSITYSYRDKEKYPEDDVVEFYDSKSDLKSIIVVNGKPIFKCRQMYVTRLLENIQAYINGDKLMQSW